MNKYYVMTYVGNNLKRNEYIYIYIYIYIYVYIYIYKLLHFAVQN